MSKPSQCLGTITEEFQSPWCPCIGQGLHAATMAPSYCPMSSFCCPWKLLHLLGEGCGCAAPHGRMFPWLWGDFLGLGGFLHAEPWNPLFFQFPLTCHSPGFTSSASGAGALSGRSRRVHTAKRRWISRGCSVIRILSPAGSQHFGKGSSGQSTQGPRGLPGTPGRSLQHVAVAGTLHNPKQAWPQPSLHKDPCLSLPGHLCSLFLLWGTFGWLLGGPCSSHPFPHGSLTRSCPAGRGRTSCTGSCWTGCATWWPGSQ